MKEDGSTLLVYLLISLRIQYIKVFKKIRRKKEKKFQKKTNPFLYSNILLPVVHHRGRVLPQYLKETAHIHCRRHLIFLRPGYGGGGYKSWCEACLGLSTARWLILHLRSNATKNSDSGPTTLVGQCHEKRIMFII